jgi:hypothetical protein
MIVAGDLSRLPQSPGNGEQIRHNRQTTEKVGEPKPLIHRLTVSRDGIHTRGRLTMVRRMLETTLTDVTVSRSPDADVVPTQFSAAVP